MPLGGRHAARWVAALFLAVIEMNRGPGPPGWERAAALVKERTGQQPRPIERLPADRLFLVTAEAETEAKMRGADLPTISRFGVEGNALDSKVQSLQEALRPELATLGCTVVDAGRPIGCGPSSKLLGLLPTTDPFVALAARGPSPGGDFGEDGGLAPTDVVSWFRAPASEVPLTTWGAGRDFVDVAFDREIGQEESRALAERIYKSRPDAVDQGAGTRARLAQQIREQRRVYFWWD